jgi:DNA-binding NarL/FixJ family response regulator
VARKHVLMIDDHPLFRSGLRMALLQSRPNLRIDEASTLLAAMDALAEPSAYDLILYDWHLPDGGGCKGLTAICQLVPGVPVVVISADEDDAVRLAAMAIGALACLSKGIDARHLREALDRFLASTSLPFDPVNQFAIRPIPRAALTPRQQDVLELMARGDPNKRIARQLGIAEATVRAHVSDILRHVCARNRTEAVVVASREGLLDR